MTDPDGGSTGGRTPTPNLETPEAPWWVVWPLVVLVVGVIGLVGWLVLPDDPGGAEDASGGTVTSAPTLQAEYGDLAPSAPVRLEVPSLEVRAPVVPIQVTDDAVLNPPDDVSVTGWWDQSARPGADSGQVLVTGHTVQDGKGVLDRLPEAQQGDRVDVVTERGRMRYEITRNRTLSRDQIAARAQDLFGQDGGNGRLVLVSCTDFDGEVYQSNVVVTARPLGKVG